MGWETQPVGGCGTGRREPAGDGARRPEEDGPAQLLADSCALGVISRSADTAGSTSRTGLGRRAASPLGPGADASPSVSGQRGRGAGRRHPSRPCRGRSLGSSPEEGLGSGTGKHPNSGVAEEDLCKAQAPAGALSRRPPRSDSGPGQDWVLGEPQARTSDRGLRRQDRGRGRNLLTKYKKQNVNRQEV